MSDVVTSWPVVSLFNFCNPKQWPTIPQTAFVEQGYTVYGANGKIGFYTEFNHEKPTVLITCRGATCGTINVCEPKSYVTGNAMALDDLDESKCSAEYLVYALRSGSLAQAISGTAQPQITRQSLTAISIPLPPLAEQRRIAEVLDRAEALRAKRRAALAQLDSLTQSLFLDLFGDPATNPMGWDIKPMGNLFSVKHGFAFKSEYFAEAGEFTLLTPGNFHEAGGYRDRGDKQKYYVGAIPASYILNKDDLLVAMTEQAPGLLGSPILIPEANKFLHNQRLGLVEVRPIAERLFLFHLFNTPAVRNQIQASSTGTKVKHTSPSKITAIKIPVPHNELQRKFARRVTGVETLKKAHRASLAELDALFASLQHRAFRGEL